MVAWPTNGSTNWNDTMKAFIDVEHNSDGTHNIAFVGAKMYLASAQAVSSVTEADIVLDTTDYESTTNMCSTSTGRITPGVAGYYHISATASLSSVATGKQVYVRIYKDTTAIGEAQINTSGTTSPMLSINTDVVMTASNYIKLAIYNGDASARNTLTGVSKVFLCVHKIGA